MPLAPASDRSTVRRRIAAVCLMLAPLADMAEAATWPVGSDGSTSSELQAAAASPGAFTAAWLLESAGAVLALVAVVALMARLRGRGRVLALIGGVLAIGGQVGVLTGGGFNAAIVPLAQQPERQVAVHALDAFNSQPVLPVFGVLIWVGLLGSLLLAIAAWRGRMVGWWVPALVVVGIVAVPLLDDDRYGLVAAASYLPFAVAEIALGIGLLRSPLQPVEESEPRMEPQPVAAAV